MYNMTRKARVLLAALAIGIGAFAAEAPRPLAAEPCGNGDGQLCSKTESCMEWVFGKICTTKYDYYLNAIRYCSMCHG